MVWQIAAQAVGAIASTALNARASSKARDAARAGRRIEALNSYRERVAAQRDYARQRAEVVAQAGNEGTLDASGTQGALVGLGSQLSAGFSYANQVDKQSRLARKAGERSAKYGQLSALVGSLGNLASAGIGAMASTTPKAVEPIMPTGQPFPPSFFAGSFPNESSTPKPTGGAFQPSFFSGRFPNGG